MPTSTYTKVYRFDASGSTQIYDTVITVDGTSWNRASLFSNRRSQQTNSIVFHLADNSLHFDGAFIRCSCHSFLRVPIQLVRIVWYPSYAGHGITKAHISPQSQLCLSSIDMYQSQGRSQPTWRHEGANLLATADTTKGNKDWSSTPCDSSCHIFRPVPSSRNSIGTTILDRARCLYCAGR